MNPIQAVTKTLSAQRYWLFLGFNAYFFTQWSMNNMNILPARVYSLCQTVGLISNKKIVKPF